MSVPAALTAVQSGLREKMTRASNSIFIAAFSGVTSFASSGVTSTGVRQDIRTLLSAVSSGSESKLYLIAHRTIVEALSVLTDSAGAAAFPQVNYNGGAIAGIPVIPCDEMTAGEMLLVDATQCAAVSGPLVFNTSNQATVQLDDAPDSPPAAAHSDGIALAGEFG
jgi:HK97 family phage major capsid protein